MIVIVVDAHISTAGVSGCPQPKLSILASDLSVFNTTWNSSKFMPATFIFDLQLSVLCYNIFKVCDVFVSLICNLWFIEKSMLISSPLRECGLM
jgi:hypothetical protein